MGILWILIFPLITWSQFAPITLNKADPDLQTIILGNGQRVRIFPIPIQRSRILHFKARKDGYLYRVSKEIDEEPNRGKQIVYEPIPSLKLKNKHDDFKRNLENKIATEKPTTTMTKTTTKKPIAPTEPPYLGTNPRAANGDFLVPQTAQLGHQDLLVDDGGSGSGDGEEAKETITTTIQSKPIEEIEEKKEAMPLVVDTLSQEGQGEGEGGEGEGEGEESLLSHLIEKEKAGVKIPKEHVHRAQSNHFNNHTDSASIPLPENSKEYVLDEVRQSITHEVIHSPNRHPELKVNGHTVVLPRMKSDDHKKRQKHEKFTEPIRDHFGTEIPNAELHIHSNATVLEIKAKILLLNRQLLELQEYVDTHTLHRRAKRQARGVGPLGDAGLARGSSGQVTAFVPLPNGDVQKFYLNPAQVGSIANPTATGPQITLGQRGDLFGSDSAVAVSPLSGGVQQLGIGSPYGGLTGGFGGASSYPSLFGGYGGQYQTSGGYPVGGAAGGGGFGGQGGFSGYAGQGGQTSSGQASNIPPPILEIKVPPPPKVDIPGCYVNGKGFVCCNKHLENVIDNTMKEINNKQKEQEAKTGQPACNLQASANLLQKSAEGVFGVSFESLVAPTDFASRTRFMDDLMCKTEQNGKYVIMYATPVPYPVARRR